MASWCTRAWREDAGVLTFEWVLLITILVVGVIGGLSAARDAVNHELGDVAAATIALDQSYTAQADSHGTCPQIVFQQSSSCFEMKVNTTSTTITPCP